MKRIFTIFILLISCMALRSQDFWEPLDGPYGGEITGALKTENYLLLYTNNIINRFFDGSAAWGMAYKAPEGRAIDTIINRGPGKLFLFLANSPGNKDGQLYQSSDQGKEWTYLRTYKKDLQISSDYLYFSEEHFIRREKLSDSSVTKFAHTFIGGHFVVDKLDNIYFTNSASIHLSIDSGKSFNKILSSDSTLKNFHIDDKGAIYFESRDAKGRFIAGSSDKGQNWSKLHISDSINGYYISAWDKMFFSKRITGDYYYDSYGIIENFNSASLTNFPYPHIDTFKIKSLMFAGDYQIVSLNDGNLYKTADKHLQNLKLVNTSFRTITKLLGGTKLLLTNQISYLSGNKFIDLNVGPEYGNEYFHISKKDYFWFATPPSLSLPDGHLSTDWGKSYKYIDWTEFPISIAENSRNEIYTIMAHRRMLAKLDSNFNFKYKIFKGYPASDLFFNKKDELFIISYKDGSTEQDTIFSRKIDTGTEDEISQKISLFSGKYIKCIISENDNLFLLTDSCIYRSTNEGADFNLILDSEKNRMKLRDLITLDTNIFVATTKGIFRSTDFGKKWKEFNDGLLNLDSYSLAKLADKSLYVSLANDLVFRCVLFTGIEDEQKANPLSISPNPATDYIEINVGAQRAVPEQIRIYNIFGEEQFLSPTDGSEGGGSSSQYSLPNTQYLKLDVSALVPGLYFVRIGSSIQKFIKI